MSDNVWDDTALLLHHDTVVGKITDIEPNGLGWCGTIELSGAAEQFYEMWAYFADPPEPDESVDPDDVVYPFEDGLDDNWFVVDRLGKRPVLCMVIPEENYVQWRD